MFSEISQNPQENTCAIVSFFLRFKQEILAQVFSCEFCEISKNTFFTEHLRWLLLDSDIFVHPSVTFSGAQFVKAKIKITYLDLKTFT